MKYGKKLLELAQQKKDTNVWCQYKKLAENEKKNKPLIELLKGFDYRANVQWPLMHYKSAVRYLQRDTKEIAATGGTNWQKYLPPRNQRIIFYPEFWSEVELDNWGKAFSYEELKNLK